MIDLEFLQKYLLTTELIKDWFHQRMIESFRDPEIAEEFKEFVLEQGIELDKLAFLINSNPRMLFDVFDENDIIIYFMIFSSPEGVRFSAAIHTGNDEVKPNPIGKQYNTRKEAEHAAVEAAFDILENKLTPVVEEIEVIDDETLTPKEETDEKDN